MAQRESIRTHTHTHGPQDTPWMVCARTPHTHTYTCMNNPPLQYLPALHNSPSLHLSFTVFLILGHFPLVSVLPTSQTPLSRHYLLTLFSLLFHSSRERILFLLFDFDESFSLSVSLHPLKSPITSDGMTPAPLMFTELCIRLPGPCFAGL